VIRSNRGASMVEYVVLVVLLIASVGVSLVALTGVIRNTLQHVNLDIGS